MGPIKLKFPPGNQLSDDQLFALCSANNELKIERDRKGQLLLMSLTGGLTGCRNSNLLTELVLWNRKEKLGFVFDSDTGFRLSNDAMRAPDAAWVAKDSWNNLKIEDKEKFPPICPDFVVELRSKSDSLDDLKAKMEEWLENGCRLAWLIDAENQFVIVYRRNKKAKQLNNRTKISGEDVLQGFELNLELIF